MKWKISRRISGSTDSQPDSGQNTSDPFKEQTGKSAKGPPKSEAKLDAAVPADKKPSVTEAGVKMEEERGFGPDEAKSLAWQAQGGTGPSATATAAGNTLQAYLGGPTTNTNTNNLSNSNQTTVNNFLHGGEPEKIGKPYHYPDAESDAVRECFVKPPAFARAFKLLKEQRVVAIHGEPGTGKFSAALYLAREIQVATRVAEQIYRFPRFDFRRQLQDDSFLQVEKRNRLYLWEGVIGDADSHDFGALLRTISATFKEQGAYFIAAISRTLPLEEDHPLYGLAAAWELPKDREGVLRAHLKEQPVPTDGKSATERDKRLASIMDSKKAVGDPDLAALSLAELRSLAERLSAARNEKDVERVWRGLLPDPTLPTVLENPLNLIKADLKNLFVDENRWEDQVAVLALSALSGTQFALFMGQIGKLDAILKRAFPPPLREASATEGSLPPQQASLRIHDLLRSDLAVRWNAVVRDCEETTRIAGTVTVERIEFIRAEWRRAVSEYVWTESTRLADPFFVWIQELLKGDEPEHIHGAIRALIDAPLPVFDRIVRKILTPWSASGNLLLQTRTAILMNFIADQLPERRENLFRLMESWCEQAEAAPSWDDGYLRQWTTAFALGAVVGIDTSEGIQLQSVLGKCNAPRSLNLLRRIAMSGGSRPRQNALWEISLNAVHDLFRVGCGPDILENLRGNEDVLCPDARPDTSTRTLGRRHEGAYASWFVSLLTLDTREDAAGIEAVPLLHLTHERRQQVPAIRVNLALLLRFALRNGSIDQAAFAGVRRWMRKNDAPEKHEDRTSGQRFLSSILVRVFSTSDGQTLVADEKRLLDFLRTEAPRSETARVILNNFT